jgi:hypothetical protein
MTTNYSLIPTDDLKALKAKDYGSVSTRTLQYIKTGDSTEIQPASPEPTAILRSLGQRLGSKLGARLHDFGSEAGKLAHNAWTGGTDPYRGTIRPILRMTGDIGNAVNDVVGEVMGVVNTPVHNKFDPLQTRYVPHGTEFPSKPSANDPVVKAGKWALKQGGEYYKLFKKTHPEVAKDLEAAAGIATWLPILGEGKIAEEGIGSAVEHVGGALEGAGARGAEEALGATREGAEGAAEGLQKGGAPVQAQPKVFTPAGTGPFGPVFNDFRGDTQGAIAHLRDLKTGEAVGLCTTRR